MLESPELPLAAVRIAVVAALLFLAVPRVLLPATGGPGEGRVLEDAARMAALTVAATLALGAAGLLDPIALMLVLLGGGAALRAAPGPLRAHSAEGRRRAAGHLYDLLERRARPRLRVPAGPVAAALLVAGAFVAAQGRGERAAGPGYAEALADLEDRGVSALDDPSEAAVALVGALGQLVEADPGAFLTTAPALASAVATAAAVGVARRLTGAWLPAVLAGAVHLTTVHGIGLAPSASPASVDVVALDLAAAVLAVLVIHGAPAPPRVPAPLVAGAAAAVAVALHPAAASIGLGALALGAGWGVARGVPRRGAGAHLGAAALGGLAGAAVVAADGALPDGAFETVSAPASAPPVALLVAGCALAVTVAAAIVVRRATGPSAGTLGLCVLCGALLAAAAAPGAFPALTDAAAARLAAPAGAVLAGVAAWALVTAVAPAAAPAPRLPRRLGPASVAVTAGLALVAVAAATVVLVREGDGVSPPPVTERPPGDSAIRPPDEPAADPPAPATMPQPPPMPPPAAPSARPTRSQRGAVGVSRLRVRRDAGGAITVRYRTDRPSLAVLQLLDARGARRGAPIATPVRAGVVRQTVPARAARGAGGGILALVPATGRGRPTVVRFAAPPRTSPMP